METVHRERNEKIMRKKKRKDEKIVRKKNRKKNRLTEPWAISPLTTGIQDDIDSRR